MRLQPFPHHGPRTLQAILLAEQPHLSLENRLVRAPDGSVRRCPKCGSSLRHRIKRSTLAYFVGCQNIQGCGWTDRNAPEDATPATPQKPPA